jgi:1-acyl-sn-glycerol-3-phosphate acyltransferase
MFKPMLRKFINDFKWLFVRLFIQSVQVSGIHKIQFAWIAFVNSL